MLKENNDKLDKLFLKYADLMNLVNTSNEDLSKLCIKKRVTASRDLRRELRGMKTLISEMVKLSSDIEKDLREQKESKKDVAS